MTPKLADLLYWQSRNRPPWAARIYPQPQQLQRAGVHECVNAHAGHKPTSGELAAWNLLSILRMMRKRRRDLHSELSRIAHSPGCAINPEKRAALARKWAARIKP